MIYSSGEVGAPSRLALGNRSPKLLEVSLERCMHRPFWFVDHLTRGRTEGRQTPNSQQRCHGPADKVEPRISSARSELLSQQPTGGPAAGCPVASTTTAQEVHVRGSYKNRTRDGLILALTLDTLTQREHWTLATVAGLSLPEVHDDQAPSKGELCMSQVAGRRPQAA